MPDLSGTLEGTSRRSPRLASLLLQLRQASPGAKIRTPALQAGLTTRRLTFREIFSSPSRFWAPQNVTVVFFNSALLVNVDNSRLSMAA
jgi:hypothetical protein